MQYDGQTPIDLEKERVEILKAFNGLLRATKDRKEADGLFPTVVAMLDKLAKRNIIHKNKAANLKSGLQVRINAL